MEIERKFLVNENINLLNLECYPKFNINQYYLCDNPEVRLRMVLGKNQECFLTIKSKGTLIREEIEYPIPYYIYKKYSDYRISHIINKNRYLISLENDLTAELDLYLDNLKDLVTVEVEFKSTEYAINFKKPNWFGNEITNDLNFKNINLARR